MSLFRSIVFASVFVGAVAGAAITAVQSVGTNRLIAQAEVYEKAGEGHHHSEADESGEVASAHHASAHEEGGWEPADGIERTTFTLAANILTAIGYALVIISLIAMRGKPVTWRDGLAWGVAAFSCVMLAPMLGLPPELPGAPSAPLNDRQLWWVATALCTAVSLALVVFKRKPWALVVALAIFAAPHLVGAPVAPEGAHALAPEALERKFIAAAVITSLLLWSMIGSLGATVFNRLEAR
ncbi:CbtA family protein [Agrobacterium pusense]|nr:CbtA family protein [Agrobacterium pusense]